MEGDQLAITIDDQPQSYIDLSVHLPVSTDMDQPSIASCGRNGEVLRAGVSVILIYITQKLNPPIVVSVNRTHALLAMVHSFSISANLVIGVLLLIFSMVTPWAPRLSSLAKRLLFIGQWWVKVTIGFGASLVLLVSSSSWLVLYLVFLTIQFLY